MDTPFTRRIITALICSGILAAAAPAMAGPPMVAGGYDRGWQHKKHHHPQHRGWDERTVYRERVIIRERPRPFREREVHHYHHYAPPHYDRAYRPYGYGRSPAVVIGIEVPPIVIPLR
ncbi:hypothetical protein [Thauera linaloolentis]|uniref:Uncharacterized protein n=1 Tax=Thauera linaloolentis (strain DSM 12138 / JCM 21573 / CCUG 41526 / CIP 105981 / IAM 15112 / NBRC 102519 / 47Lol) TaxID=1123367 RepID=N6XZ64_THAL4|nr:hypothetical protein [Thauera linaloolentis]ENO84540.1 hypothetical protein C666_17155 [Thauera linaloolentis 47Lol = DSM 12138]MCM8564349.1 hypothetical protein [Thauera linaloolentis]